jgi:hypothetical protein
MVAAAIATLGLAIWVPPVLADTGDIIAPSDPSNPQVESGWQAGTCKEEPAETTEPGFGKCSIKTPSLFFEQASAHPNWGFTQFIVKHEPGILPAETKVPVGEVRTIRADLPVGLSVNPGATERCPRSVYEPTPGKPEHIDECESTNPDSKVGESQVEVAAPVVGPISPQPGATIVPVFNVEPKDGQPARFGLELGGNPVFLEGDVAWWSDYHEGFTIHVPAALPEALGEALGLGTGQKGLVLRNRLPFEGRSGDETFLTTPTTCLGPAYADSWTKGEAPNGPSGKIYSTFLRADSVAQPNPTFPEGSSFFESPIPPISELHGPGTQPIECATIPYKPGLGVDPHTVQTDSPSGAAVDVTVPHLTPKEDEQDSSDTRSAKMTLPLGMGLNPSSANGLKVCTDAQFGKGTKNPVACPPESKIGTVTIKSAPLPEGDLEGNVYVGQQLSRDPTSGNEYRIFVDAESARYGLSVRLVGNVSANPITGQLTTTFSETPQVPFESFKITLDGGPRAALSSPPTCGPNDSTTVMTPWSGNPPATPGDSFTLTSAPGGGACAKTLGERPFGPSFGAKSTNPKGGAYSQFNVDIVRSDGNQELKGATVDLPPGLSAKLAGVKYCPPAALLAAAANSGVAEAAKSSCPESSLIGTASVASGTGTNPVHIDGKAFLTGPYNGAPLSLAIVTPATAGPFDLGTVVVRVALFVNPETAQVHAVSDPIPNVFGGALLDIREAAVHIDRKQFSLNPTNCSPMTVGGTLRGGGSDPANPAAFSSDPVSVPFQVNECDKLGFKPKLSLRLFGGTRRGKSPRLRAVLMARKGDANIGRAAVGLPHALFLKQSSLSKICTRVQFAADECPKKSVYGFARAFTPLLDDPLEGPVYLRSSDNPLPDVVAALHGQVDVDLVGRVDSFHGGIRTTYDTVPDVPVSKFVLTLPGGKKGLLQNSRNLCKKKVRAIVRFKAQNGKKANPRTVLRTPCSRKKHGK